MRSDLYQIDGVPFKGQKMLIPKKLRGTVLRGLHAANQGVSGMQANASERFFWPGLSAAIKQLRAQCGQCNRNAPSQQAEPMIFTPPPEYPFQQVVADFAEIEGHDFLVYADRYSGWLEVAKMNSKTERAVEHTFLKWFSTYGVPEEMSSDGGPPFNAAAYNDFLHRWGVKKRLSSAHYPQSNGRAEAAVKSAKRILEGNINPVTGQLNTEEAARAFMTHRNTPLQDTGCSPSITLFGRPMRDHLPRKPSGARREWQMVADARENALAKRQLRSDPKALNRELIPLSVGDSVQVQNQVGNRPRRWYATGTIVECLPHRQYRVVLDGSRRVTLRNRKFLRLIDPICREGTLPDINEIQAVPEEKWQPKGTPSPRVADSPPMAQVTELGPGEIGKVVTPMRPPTKVRAPRRILPDMDQQGAEPEVVLQRDDVGENMESQGIPPLPASNGEGENSRNNEREKPEKLVEPRRGTRIRKKRVPYSP